MGARLEQWPERLADLIEARHAQPFAWGVQDCALFACDAVQAMTGIDPAIAFRGRYKDRRGAYSALGQFLGVDGKRHSKAALGSVWAKIAVKHGWWEVPPAFAQRGDVGLLDLDGRGTLAICMGAIFAAAGPSGVVFIPHGHARRAWHI